MNINLHFIRCKTTTTIRYQLFYRSLNIRTIPDESRPKIPLTSELFCSRNSFFFFILQMFHTFSPTALNLVMSLSDLKKKEKKKKLEIEALTSHMRESDSVRRRNNTLDEEEQQRRQKRKTNLISDAKSQIQSKVQSSVKEG